MLLTAPQRNESSSGVAPITPPSTPPNESALTPLLSRVLTSSRSRSRSNSSVLEYGTMISATTPGTSACILRTTSSLDIVPGSSFRLCKETPRRANAGVANQELPELKLCLHYLFRASNRGELLAQESSRAECIFDVAGCLSRWPHKRAPRLADRMSSQFPSVFRS